MHNATKACSTDPKLIPLVSTNYVGEEMSQFNNHQGFQDLVILSLVKATACSSDKGQSRDKETQPAYTF